MERSSTVRTCIRIIMVGLLNILAYTITYAYIGGDAWNGQITDGKYYVRGHFLRSAEGMATDVSQAQWIYSFLHSISIPPTLAAMLIAMLVIARPHITMAYQDGRVSGQTLVAIIGTVIVLVATAATAMMTLDFVGSIT